MSIKQGSKTIAGMGGSADGETIKNQNTNSSIEKLKMWEGTEEEYRALPVKASDTLYNTTDDSNVIDIRALGQIVQSTIPLVDAGLHLLDGSVIAYGSYKAFVDYMSGLVTDYPDLFTTEANWQSSVSTYGVCGKFVYDSVGKTVRLPKYSNKIYSSLPSELGVKGNGMVLGLTDGTQNRGLSEGASNYLCAGPGQYGSNIGITITNNPNGADRTLGITLDPTKSGMVADLSTITTALDGYWYICIATYPKTQIEVDIDEIATDLNGKVDKANLMKCQVVVESWHDGTEWYRVWSDGWCEQGNTISMYSSNSVINLFKSFENTNYAVQISYEGTSVRGDVPSVNTKTISTFKVVHSAGLNDGFALTWEAKGYIA